MAELPIAIARCPVSGGALRAMTPVELARAGERFEAGLIAQDAGIVYGVTDGIARLLADQAVRLDLPGAVTGGMRAEKDAVRAFYDEVGWKCDEEKGVFIDTARFVDTRPVVQEYFAGCRRRIGRALPSGGRYLLDVASGPVQFPEYVDYQRGFDARICVDLSALALREARRNVGERGVLVQGDITNLPLRDDCVDAAISLHTIYHVPRDEQATAFRELHRVLRPGGVAVVAYSWGHTPWSELSRGRRPLHLPTRVVRRARRALRAPGDVAKSGDGQPDLYFHAFDYHWFVRQPWPFRYEIRAHRLFTSKLLEKVIHPWLGGRRLLALIDAVEERLPHLAGRFGRYPLILVFKD